MLYFQIFWALSSCGVAGRKSSVLSIWWMFRTSTKWPIFCSNIWCYYQAISLREFRTFEVPSALVSTDASLVHSSGSSTDASYVNCGASWAVETSHEILSSVFIDTDRLATMSLLRLRANLRELQARTCNHSERKWKVQLRGNTFGRGSSDLKRSSAFPCWTRC